MWNTNSVSAAIHLSTHAHLWSQWGCHRIANLWASAMPFSSCFYVKAFDSYGRVRFLGQGRVWIGFSSWFQLKLFVRSLDRVQIATIYKIAHCCRPKVASGIVSRRIEDDFEVNFHANFGDLGQRIISISVHPSIHPPAQTVRCDICRF